VVNLTHYNASTKGRQSVSVKTKAVLVQLGSPRSPSVSDVRHFLREFLGDPRVVDLPPLLWKIILYLFILPFRPKRSAAAYKRIWNGVSFPLVSITESFAKKVAKALPNPEELEVNHAFLLCPPSIDDVWSSWERELDQGKKAADKILAIAMFPQYSESTVASGMDAFAKVLAKKVRVPPFEFITDFHRSHAFIDHSARIIDQYLAQWKAEGKAVDKLVMSFHGIPKRRVIVKKDPYYRQCYETFFLISERLKEISSSNIECTFQSRFGSEEWLTPYTDERCRELVDQGNKRIAVYCPSFVVDCLETIDEIGNELGHEIKERGGEIHCVPCLNDDEKWCQSFAQFIDVLARGNSEEKKQMLYPVAQEKIVTIPEQKLSSPPISPEAKAPLKIVFLTLFLDLIGFSIIFPLFPALARHYLEHDSDNFFLRLIFDSITGVTNVGGNDVSSVVLFGGALGALYSLLQFIAAPLWGGLSDRIGRKPVLLISVAGLALSYVLWFFAGSFSILILGRFIGGLMGGNISTATAVVADVTEKSNRSRGMAVIGIAFALGFILGPAMGGILSSIDLTVHYPALKQWGVNPFSLPALVACVLSCFNLFFLGRNFVETLPPEKRGQNNSDRTANVLKLFRPLPYAGVNATNFAHFLFLAAFSGMEFTLTFLAAERLGYSPMQNGVMFIYIGVLIALVQGGYVRRKAREVGERQMARNGLIILIPGLLLIAYASSSALLYAGLFFLAVGSSMAIPTLTSLVSLYTPASEQGQSVGIFRSLGALARVLGPIAASLVYWRYGASVPYIAGALFLLLPIVLVARLPLPSHEEI
jgi:ferrochelatase